MSLSDLFTRLMPQPSALLSPFAGFIAGWLTFELNELRRRYIQRRAMRHALIAELQAAEWVLAGMVIHSSFGTNDPERGVHELRWYLTEGHRRGRFPDIPTEFPKPITSATCEEELISFFKGSPRGQPRRAIELPMPILHAVLTIPGSGFKVTTLQKLNEVRWQMHLLGDEARWMNEFLKLSFTVADHNHQVVIDNHKSSMQGYRRRMEYALDMVRETLGALRTI